MKPQEPTIFCVLRPYDVREGIDLASAAKRAGKSETTIRNWCNERGIGRRIGGGVWVVSKVALAMHLDGDREALEAYLAGDRSSPTVKDYFARCEVPLPRDRAKPKPAALSAVLLQ